MEELWVRFPLGPQVEGWQNGDCAGFENQWVQALTGSNPVPSAILWFRLFEEALPRPRFARARQPILGTKLNFLGYF